MLRFYELNPIRFFFWFGMLENAANRAQTWDSSFVDPLDNPLKWKAKSPNMHHATSDGDTYS